MEIKDIKLIDFTDETKKVLENFMLKDNKISCYSNLNTKQQLKKYLNKVVAR